MITKFQKIKFTSIEIMLILVFKHLTCVVGNEDNSKSLIYILVWANIIQCRPWLLMKPEQQYFIEKKCRFQNCFLTTNRSYFSNVTKFDVVLFNGGSLKYIDIDMDFPANRLEDQLYIFMCDEPPALTLVPKHYNGFFNLTWTYRLDSDIFFKYVTVKNNKGKVIGPKTNMNWIDFKDMKPISPKMKNKLLLKNKAALWYVSRCETSSQREVFVQELIIELQKYALEVDVCGDCNRLRSEFCDCRDEKCGYLIQSDYYFYLSFEDSMHEDHVSKQLVTATQNLAVPIVYGGANYTRFMPNGSYIDASGLDAKELARIMNDTIHDDNKYYDFFKWHSYYSLHDPMEIPETDEICSLCAFLNNYLQNDIRYKRSVVTNLDIFWMK